MPYHHHGLRPTYLAITTTQPCLAPSAALASTAPIPHPAISLDKPTSRHDTTLHRRRSRRYPIPSISPSSNDGQPSSTAAPSRPQSRPALPSDPPGVTRALHLPSPLVDRGPFHPHVLCQTPSVPCRFVALPSPSSSLPPAIAAPQDGRQRSELAHVEVHPVRFHLPTISIT